MIFSGPRFLYFVSAASPFLSTGRPSSLKMSISKIDPFVIEGIPLGDQVTELFFEFVQAAEAINTALG